MRKIVAQVSAATSPVRSGRGYIAPEILGRLRCSYTQFMVTEACRANPMPYLIGFMMSGPKKSVYRFGKDVVDGDGTMQEILGGKGAGLAEMTLLSVPVPPGFTITTDVCRYYLEHGSLPPHLQEEIAEALHWLETAVGRHFNDPVNPLLVSVRSGAPISMPGMMDTILNVGLNDNCVV
jgi:hypothetical protein